MTRPISIMIFISLLHLSCGQKRTNELESIAINPKLDSLKLVISKLTSENDSLSWEIERLGVEFRALEHLSMGEFKSIDTNSDSEPYGYAYRVEIYLSEIYKSLYLTRIDYVGEGLQQIRSHQEIDIESMFSINNEQTNSLEFIKWHSPTEFEIKVINSSFILTIVNSEPIQVRVK